MVICPRCRSTHVRLAAITGFDHLLRIFALRPRRCKACYLRYYQLPFGMFFRSGDT